MRRAFLLLALVACSPEAPSGGPSEPSEAASYGEVTGSSLADAGICGIDCEPGATRPCAGGALQVCAPSGLGWYTCGTEADQAAPSSCPKGTRCQPRDGGLLACQCDPDAGAGDQAACPDAGAL